jgi:hypothetical protein
MKARNVLALIGLAVVIVKAPRVTYSVLERLARVIK